MHYPPSVHLSFDRVCSLALFLALGGCAGAEPNCADGALAAALMAATPGQTVELGTCTARGSFSVPAGVTLRGRGPASSRVESTTVAVVLGAGATIEGVRIDHAAGHGIAAVSASSVTIRNVEIHSTLGRAAIGLADVTTVTLTDVTTTGPVASETEAQALPARPSETDACLYGIVLQRVGAATLTNISASGFAAGGVVSSDTALTWNGGAADGDLTLGVWIDGGSATLTDVTIRGTLRGFAGNPPYGLAIGRDAVVGTDGLVVENTHQGFGVIQDGGEAEHMGMLCTGHAGGGLVVQRSTSLRIGGGSMIVDNGFAGIVTIEAAGVVVEDTMVAMTALSPRILSSWTSADVGDGVQLVRPSGPVVLRDLELASSGRVGLLADLGGMDAALVEVSNVSTSETMQYGCVMQNGTGITAATLDGLCTRDEPARVADLSAEVLSIVGIVMPSEIPATGALDGIVMPSE